MIAEITITSRYGKTNNGAIKRMYKADSAAPPVYAHSIQDAQEYILAYPLNANAIVEQMLGSVVITSQWIAYSDPLDAIIDPACNPRDGAEYYCQQAVIIPVQTI